MIDYLYTIERFTDRISKAEIKLETNIAFIIIDSSAQQGTRAIPRDRNSFTELEAALTNRNARERERLARLRRDCADQQARVDNIPAWMAQQRKALA